MKIADQVSTDLLDTLGVPWQGQHITGVTLRIRSQKLPVVVVHRHLGPEPFSEQVSQRFCLVPVTDALAPFTNQPNPAIEHALCVIGKALCASHGCVATDLPETQVTDTSWRIDHMPEMAQLAVLKAALGSVSSDTGP